MRLRKILSVSLVMLTLSAALPATAVLPDQPDHDVAQETRGRPLPASAERETPRIIPRAAAQTSLWRKTARATRDITVLALGIMGCWAVNMAINRFNMFMVVAGHHFSNI